VASHELRTPVAALQLQLEALSELVSQRGIGTEDRMPERLARSRATTSRLASLIERVLDVSRITMGKLDLERVPQDLAETARDILARHEDVARSAGCELRLSAPRPVMGSWDRVRIEQVITNLLSNALKFGAGKPIEVSVDRDGSTAVLKIRDHGAGVDPAAAERIMRRFERAVSHRNYGGLGLGLYIAGQIVEAHGGKIEVSSRTDEGAAFAVILPCGD
jgi:signal transduction histidine kinase